MALKKPRVRKFGTGLFGAFYDRLEPGHKIGHNLHHQQNGHERAMGEERRKISWRTFAHSEAYKQHEQRQRSEGGPVLKRGAQADSAIVQQSQQSGQAQPDEQVRQVNWLACNAVEFYRIQRRKDVAGDPANCDRFPRAHDEVSQDHHPAGGEADRLRKNPGGVCDFAGRIRHSRDQPAVHIADWQ